VVDRLTGISVPYLQFSAPTASLGKTVSSTAVPKEY